MARRVVEQIVAQGFGSYGTDEAGVLRLGGRGPVAVVGDNGTGKSTIASKALVWCCFGKGAPERMGTSTQAIKGKSVIADGCRFARVEVIVRDLVSGERWNIERSRDRKGGDKVVVMSSVAGSLTEDAIVGIIGCTYEVFCKTVVRGQGDVWAFAEATDARKREILDEVSGANALGPFFDKAKAVRDVARADAANLDAQAGGLRVRLASAEQRTRGLVKQRDEWDRGRAADIALRRATVASLEAAEATAAQVDADAAATEAARLAIEATRPGIDWAPYRAAERAAAAALAAAGANRAAAEARWTAVRDLAPGQSCPTCAQVIQPTAPVAVQRAAAEAPFVAARSAEQDAQARFAAASAAIEQATTWFKGAEAIFTGKLAALPKRAVSGQLAAAQAATKGARDALATAEKSDNPYVSGVGEAVQDETRIARDLAVIEEAAMLARQRGRLAEAAIEALSPKGARASLAEATLGAIEVEANRWLDSLSQGRMSLHFQRAENVERIETIVRTVDRASGAWVERDLLNFSGGERTRVNMACDLGVAAAFDAAGTAVSLLVLDEAVFSGLDSAGQAAIVQLLHAAGVADVVVVDHNPQLSAALPRSVRATIGADGYTRLTETPPCP